MMRRKVSKKSGKDHTFTRGKGKTKRKGNER
jgi:hypothetical protein